MTNSKSSDTVTFEVLRRAFESLGDEMAIVLARSAHSMLLRNSYDCTTALLDRNCEVITQGRTSPLHLLSLMVAAEAVKNKYEGEFKPGDIFILNDPYEGGSHLPDIFLISPLFVDGEHRGYLGSEAHHADVGGAVPGSNSPHSTEIYQEGFRIPPVRLYDGGRPVKEMFDLLQANVRLPDTVTGDLAAQVAALHTGEEAFLRLVERFGIQAIEDYISDSFEYAERLTRAQIQEWPDGKYSFEDWIDDDGVTNEPIPICVEITVKGDRVRLDYSGTGPQVASALNTPGAFTRAVAMVAVRLTLAADIPHNSGFIRSVDVDIPSGTILNAQHPAAVAARSLAAIRAFDVTMGCLAQIVPNRGMAAGEGGNALITIWGEGKQGDYIFTDMHFGAWGGRHDRDGVTAICSPLAAVANTPIEIIEHDTPLEISHYEFVKDTCGPGKFRGGFGVSRGYRVGRGTATGVVRSDRQRFSPYGLMGGKHASRGQNVVLRADGQQEQLPSKPTFTLDEGDVYVSILPGGGGWGDPLEREPQLVLDDLKDKMISVEFAREKFGVVLSENSGIDDELTLTKRHQLKAARKVN